MATDRILASINQGVHQAIELMRQQGVDVRAINATIVVSVSGGAINVETGHAPEVVSAFEQPDAATKQAMAEAAEPVDEDAPEVDTEETPVEPEPPAPKTITRKPAPKRKR